MSNTPTIYPSPTVLPDDAGRSERITFRLSPQELATLQGGGRLKGMTPGQFARFAGLYLSRAESHGGGGGNGLAEVDQTQLRQLLHLLGSTGTLFNQQVRSLNALALAVPNSSPEGGSPNSLDEQGIKRIHRIIDEIDVNAITKTQSDLQGIAGDLRGIVKAITGLLPRSGNRMGRKGS